jgi:uncharacterized protein (TIGR02452 family)
MAKGNRRAPALISQETLDIIAKGGYLAPSGRRIEFEAQVKAAASGTRLYRPDDYAGLEPAFAASEEKSFPAVEVTTETTFEAARRLVLDEGVCSVVALNYASARNPGGGFLGNARAQEEALCRASALYPCLLPQTEYYRANRRQDSFLYTDHIIYSPEVPFFRSDDMELLEQPVSVSVITAPAPNRGEAARRDPDCVPAVRVALARRSEAILAVAAAHGHRTVVLGAWGCGVFRNDPTEVAAAFHGALLLPRFAGVFARVVFAVSSQSRHIFEIFRAEFLPQAGT